MLNETTGKSTGTGNGSATAFTGSFRILSQSDIEVFVDLALQTLTTHYTVTGVGNDTFTVNFLTAPSNGVAILIRRKQPIKQGSNYIPNEGPPAERIESDFDKLVMMAQMLKEALDRAIKVGKSSVFTATEADDPIASRFLRAKSDLSGFDWAIPASI